MVLWKIWQKHFGVFFWFIMYLCPEVELRDIYFSTSHSPSCVICIMMHCRYFDTVWKDNHSCYFDTNIGWWATPPSIWNLHSEWPTPFEMCWLRQIPTYNISTIRDGKKVQSWQIESWPRAFQWATDRVLMLLLSPAKGGSKSDFLKPPVPLRGWSVVDYHRANPTWITAAILKITDVIAQPRMVQFEWNLGGWCRMTNP